MVSIYAMLDSNSITSVSSTSLYPPDCLFDDAMEAVKVAAVALCKDICQKGSSVWLYPYDYLFDDAMEAVKVEVVLLNLDKLQEDSSIFLFQDDGRPKNWMSLVAHSLSAVAEHVGS